MRKTKQRQAQRKRIAKSIKGIRALQEGQNKKDALISLLGIAKNYPKPKG